jgi:hypothetical protein
MWLRKLFDGDEEDEDSKMSGSCKWRFLFAEPKDILRIFCNNIKWDWNEMIKMICLKVA